MQQFGPSHAFPKCPSAPAVTPTVTPSSICSCPESHKQNVTVQEVAVVFPCGGSGVELVPPAAQLLQESSSISQRV